MKLNIGCGQDKMEGYIGIDNVDFEQEYVRDIEKECLPFDNGTVDEIICKHALEHITDFWFVVNEMWRVLKSGGKLLIIVPHVKNKGAYYPSHHRQFNEYSFEGLYEGNKIERMWEKESLIVNNKDEIHLKLVKPKYEEINLKRDELDLACGATKDRNAIGIDIGDYGQEIIWDITKGIPFYDNRFVKVKLHNILEHLVGDDLLYVMRECHRVLKKDGILDIIVPYAGSDGSFRDPTHKSFWTETSFDYFTGKRPKYYKINPNHLFEEVYIKEKNGGAIYVNLKPIK